MSALHADSDQALAIAAERSPAPATEVPPPVQMFQMLASFQVSQAQYATFRIQITDSHGSTVYDSGTQPATGSIMIHS